MIKISGRVSAQPRPTMPLQQSTTIQQSSNQASASSEVKTEDATLRVTINDFSKLNDTVCSESKIVNGVPW